MDFNTIKSKLDLKMIFIIILAITLILSFIFRKGNIIDNYKIEKEQLAKENKKLKHEFDSITAINIWLEKDRKFITDSLNMTKIALNNSTIRIKDLEKRQNEIHKIVNNLNANGVANEFSNFLNGKNK